MNVLLALVILTAGNPAPNDVPSKEAVEVFRCDFDDAADKNYDGWPDRWTRRKGPGYPLFLPIKIIREQSNQAKALPNHLRIELDGGAAAVFSPPVPISPLFSYVVQADLQTEQLARNIAYISLTFFDSHGKLLETHESTHSTHVKTWTQVVLGPIVPGHADASTVVVGLHLRPRTPSRADLNGAALFKQVKLSRMPRVLLRCNQKHHLYTNAQQVEVTCDASGLLEPNPVMTFALHDVHGNLLATQDVKLHDAVATMATGDHGSQALPRAFAARATWKPPIPGYGFYRVVASMNDGASMRLEREATLAVLRPIRSAPQGEFGWSLPQGDRELPLGDLVSLLGQVGIQWLKFPMWFAADDATRPDRLAWFADRVSAQHIQIIGLLDTPPTPVAAHATEHAKIPIATAFVEAPFWKAAVDPVMTRLSLKVRYWQLGGDDDTSFVDFPDLEQNLAQIKQYFLKYGQEVQIGLAWPWLHEPPTTSAPAWDFLTRTAQPALSQREITAYLPGKAGSAPNTSQAQCWMTLEPLSRKRFRLDIRTRDLVARMLAAKIGRAEGVFIPDPFSHQHGLLNTDGTPGELLLPWRTTSLLLGGAEYLGQIQLPGGSVNHLFRRDGQAVMVVWNDQPTQETLYLGEHVEHLDLWGRVVPHYEVELAGHPAQLVMVGNLPTFVTGLNLPVAMWRIGFVLDSTRVPAVLGRDETVTYRFTNTFPQSVGGETKLHVPKDWIATPEITTFRASAEQQREAAFQVRFNAEAQSGTQLLRFDVALTAERDYHFSVYKQLEVGSGDIAIQLSARLNENGELLVEPVFVNQSDEVVSFNCLLFANDRRRERQAINNLGRGRQSVQFVLPDGEKLIGQPLLIRAEEIGGDRVLNYRIVPE